jgi:hypothetical protein
VTQLRVEVLDELGGVASTSLIPDPNGLVNVEVHEAGASATGFDPPAVVIEVDGTSDPNAVKNIGGAPGLLVLEAADPVPSGIPVGTVILRRS